MVDGQIADLAVHEGHAYLNSWDEPSCTKGGTYIVDIANPASPQEIGFLEAADGYYHGEGAHVVSLDTPQFTGDLLAVNDEACSNADDSPGGRAGHRRRLRPLRRHRSGEPGDAGRERGRRSPDGSLVQDPGGSPTPTTASSSGRTARSAFLVGVDNTELADVDIYNITDPTNPELIADLDLVDLFPDDRRAGRQRRRNLQPRHGREADRRPDADAGQLLGRRLRPARRHQPASPTLITDTDFAGGRSADRLRRRPEGNAHEAEYSHDNEFFLAADEDFEQFRLTSEITEAPFDGVEFNSARLRRGADRAGDDDRRRHRVRRLRPAPARSPAPPAGVTIAVAERGVCAGGFQEKIDAIEDAGYEMAVIFNNSFGAGGGRCEALINMLVDPDTIDDPGDLRRPRRRPANPRHVRRRPPTSAPAPRPRHRRTPMCRRSAAAA